MTKRSNNTDEPRSPMALCEAEEPRKQQAVAQRPLLSECYCSQVNMVECGYVDRAHGTAEVPHAPYQYPAVLPLAQRQDCVVFSNVHEDTSQTTYLVPTTMFNAEELDYLQRLADTATTKTFVAQWGAGPHKCFLNKGITSPENLRIYNYGKRLGWTFFDDGEPNVTDLADATLSVGEARPVMIIAGTDYY